MYGVEGRRLAARKPAASSELLFPFGSLEYTASLETGLSSLAIARPSIPCHVSNTFLVMSKPCLEIVAWLSIKNVYS